VDESYPTGGVPNSYYSRQKAEVERRLDYFESQNPELRVVRMRQALTFKREAAEGQRRLFGGPLFPSPFARPGLIRVVPQIEGLRSQVVHSYDVGEAYRLALLNELRGAFNLATEPVVDPQEMARVFNARAVPVPVQLARAGARISWQLRLQPVPEGWLDMALELPIMDVTRAHGELGWSPQYNAEETLLDELEGLRTRAGLDTPPLSRGTSGPFRIRELLTGVGGREP
jgi:nucleoside-diphosphate-sugar epimerase